MSNTCTFSKFQKAFINKKLLLVVSAEHCVSLKLSEWKNSVQFYRLTNYIMSYLNSRQPVNIFTIVLFYYQPIHFNPQNDQK